MIRCKISITRSLSAAGYTSNRIRNEHIFGERTMQKLRTGGLPSHAELNKICQLLNLQPGDILEYVPDDEASN